MLLAAAGLARLRPRAIGALAGTLIAVLSASQVAEYYQRELYENWRAASRFVLAEEQPGDAIVFFPNFAPAAFASYVRKEGVAGPTDAGWRPLSGSRRVWLAIRASDSTGLHVGLERLRSLIQERYRLEDRRAFHGVAIERYVLSASR